MTYLIINADDFGGDVDIDRGIIEAFQNGVLTSTTLLVTFAKHWEESALVANAVGLPTGIHLSLTQGHSVAPKEQIPDLVDDNGRLKLSAGRIVAMGLQSSAKNCDLYAQMRLELDAQISVVKSRGIRVSHLDSHQHVHLNPTIFEMVEELAVKHDVPAMRFVREPFFKFHLHHGVVENLRRKNPIKAMLARFLTNQIVPKLRTNNAFFGVMQSGNIDKWSFKQFLRSIAGTDLIWEVGIHPGYPGQVRRPDLEAGVFEWFASPSRRRELDVLLDPEVRELIRKEQIELISYATLP